MALLSLLFVFLSFRNAAMKLKTAHFRLNQKSQDDFNSKLSMSFTLLIFLIIFAEIFRGIAYYDLGHSTAFVYLARILLVLSLYTLVHFSFLDLAQVKSLKTLKT